MRSNAPTNGPPSFPFFPPTTNQKPTKSQPKATCDSNPSPIFLLSFSSLPIEQWIDRSNKRRTHNTLHTAHSHKQSIGLFCNRTETHTISQILSLLLHTLSLPGGVSFIPSLSLSQTLGLVVAAAPSQASQFSLLSFPFLSCPCLMSYNLPRPCDGCCEGDDFTRYSLPMRMMGGHDGHLCLWMMTLFLSSCPPRPGRIKNINQFPICSLATLQFVGSVVVRVDGAVQKTCPRINFFFF